MYEESIKVSFRRSALIDSALERCLANDKANQTYEGVWTLTNTIRRLMQLSYVPHKFTDLSIYIPGINSLVRFTVAENKSLAPKRASEPNSHWGRRLLVSGLIKEGYLKADQRGLRLKEG